MLSLRDSFICTVMKTKKSNKQQFIYETTIHDKWGTRSTCFYGGGDWGTHTTSAQCLGEQITLENSKRCT